MLNGIEANKIPFETPKMIIYTINEDVMGEMDVQLSSLVRNQVNEYIHAKK